MIPAIRLWNDTDGRSHVEHGSVSLNAHTMRSAETATTTAAFQETAGGGSFAWHTAPRRQYVITLAGVLDFITRDGETFRLEPGMVLVAEDTDGTGHRWELLGDDPWRRLYVGLADDAKSGFQAQ
ncbi:cupin domain-containing protein [Gordonia otitidis]|uniref:cupin domain-containing protein n=1 Tax=Gordonia otitidis TaxID=249058 RepID=UPI0002F00147|nr:cupin domain-containing protein [Gordonia otitidis]